MVEWQGHTDMAGRPKISENRRKKMGLAPLQHACKDIVGEYMDSTHPLALTKSQQEQMNAISALSHEYFTQNVLDQCKLGLMQGLNQLNREMSKMHIVRLPETITHLLKAIKDIQGEPTHRVEVKRQMTAKQFNELLENLPKKEAEVI